LPSWNPGRTGPMDRQPVAGDRATPPPPGNYDTYYNKTVTTGPLWLPPIITRKHWTA
jgi:hypothetical protein